MSVYFAQSGEGGPVKIGSSETVGLRLTGLQTGSAAPLTLLRQIDGGATVERWCHKKFKASRIRGEWFEFCPEMMTVEVPLALIEADGAPDRSDADEEIECIKVFDSRINQGRDDLNANRDLVVQEALIRRALKQIESFLGLSKEVHRRGLVAAERGNTAALKIALGRARVFFDLAEKWKAEFDRLGGRTAIEQIDAMNEARRMDQWRRDPFREGGDQ